MTEGKYVRLEKKDLERVEKFRKENYISTLSEALRILVLKGLEFVDKEKEK